MATFSVVDIDSRTYSQRVIAPFPSIASQTNRKKSFCVSSSWNKGMLK